MNLEKPFQTNEKEIKKVLTELSISAWDKAELFLLLKDFKKVAQITIGDTNIDSVDTRNDPLSKEALDVACIDTETQLRKLGLFSLRNYDNDGINEQQAAELIVAKDPVLLPLFQKRYTAMQQPEHDLEEDRYLGEMSGFPKTAIDAFLKGEEALIEDTDPEFSKATEVSDALAFVHFRLSKEHWREELVAVKKMTDEIKEGFPEVYTAIVDEKRQ